MAKLLRVEESELIKLVLNYMKKRNMFKSYMALELESQVQVESLSKEMKFFRMLILEGSFEEAEQFLIQFQQRLGDAYQKAIFELKRQRYFELIEAKPDIELLVKVLKDIEKLVSPEVYRNLCFFLTLKSVHDHPEFMDWSIQKVINTAYALRSVRPLLRVLGKNFQNTGQTYQGDLQSLVQKLVSLESDELKNNTTVQLSSLLHDDRKVKVEFISEKKQDRLPPGSTLYQNKQPNLDALSQSVQVDRRLYTEVPYPPTSNDEGERQQPEMVKSKLAFHNRIKSNEIEPSESQIKKQAPPNLYSFRNESQQPIKNKNPSEDPDKVVIIEKLYISDGNNDGSEQESFEKKGSHQQSSLFNYNFEEMVQAGHLSDSHPIRAAIFSADGEYFAIGTNSKSLRIYSMKSLLTRESIQASNEIPILYERKNHHLGSIYCIDWSRTGRLIATGSNDKTVKIMQVPDLNDPGDCEEMQLVGHKGIIRTLSFTQDETKLLSAGQIDGCIRVWDIQTGQQIRTLEGHSQAIYCLQIGGDGSYQVSAGLDKTLRVWDFRQSKPIATILMSAYAEINYVSLSESANNYNLQNIIKGSKKTNMNVNSQQSLAALAHSDGTVTIWDLPSQRCIQQIEHHTMDCRCVEFDPTSRYLATASFDSTLTIYDFEQQRLVSRINNHEDRVVLCKWHPFYPFILSTSADSTGRIFAPRGFLTQLIKSFHNH